MFVKIPFVSGSLQICRFFLRPKHETGSEHRSKNYCEQATTTVLLVLQRKRLPENGVKLLKRVASKADTGFGVLDYDMTVRVSIVNWCILILLYIVSLFHCSDRKPTFHVGCAVFGRAHGYFWNSTTFSAESAKNGFISIHVNLLTNTLQTVRIEMKFQLKLCRDTRWTGSYLQRYFQWQKTVVESMFFKQLELCLLVPRSGAPCRTATGGGAVWIFQLWAL